MNKKKIIHIILISLLAIGCILVLVGCYYLIVKAGIPYQDPTEEMLQRYYRNMEIGDKTFLIGMGIVIIDCIGIIVAYFKFKKQSTKK